MNTHQLIPGILLVLVFTVCAAAQRGVQSTYHLSSASAAAAHGLGQAGVIIVGSAAKVGWATTKFTARHVAAPAAKTVVFKAAPRAAGFAARHGSKLAAKYGVPMAMKLSLL